MNLELLALDLDGSRRQKREADTSHLSARILPGMVRSPLDDDIASPESLGGAVVKDTVNLTLNHDAIVDAGSSVHDGWEAGPEVNNSKGRSRLRGEILLMRVLSVSLEVVSTVKVMGVVRVDVR